MCLDWPRFIMLPTKCSARPDLPDRNQNWTDYILQGCLACSKSGRGCHGRREHLSFQATRRRAVPRWSQKFGRGPDSWCLSAHRRSAAWHRSQGDVTGQAIEIDAADWIMFDMDRETVQWSWGQDPGQTCGQDFLQLKNLTIKGKLSFDDGQGPVRLVCIFSSRPQLFCI